MLAKIFVLLFVLITSSCPNLKTDPLPITFELTFVTGANKGAINYSWTHTEPSDKVNYTLFILKGWYNANEVIANGILKASGTDSHRGTFTGEAGEWYSAVLLAKTETDEVHSQVIQARARSTEPGEFDLRFGVIADTHIGYPEHYSLHRRFEKVLDWYNTMDVTALAIVGDITAYGRQSDWDIFTRSWENHKGGLQLIAVAGNHEFDGSLMGEDINYAADRFEAATGQKLNAHYVINGYHFIVLSPGDGSFLDQGEVGGAIASGRTEVPGSARSGAVPLSVREWLRERIDIAKIDAPGKPIFVFYHWSIQNTVYRSNITTSTTSFGSDPFTGFFRNDPEVVFFNGHHHRPNNDPRAIWQGGFTAINASSLYYLLAGASSNYLGNSTDGLTNSVQPKIAGWPGAAGQGMIISVKGSIITVKNYDFDFSEGPQPLGNVVRIPQTWEFDVSRPIDFPYTNAKREAQKTAPVFDVSKPANTGLDGITIMKITDTTVEVEFPQARIPGPNLGSEIVFSYRFDFINRQTGVIDRSARQWSDFMLTPRLQKPTYTQLIGGLRPDTEYELRIYAYGSFQERSGQCLIAIFRTSSMN